MAEFGEKDVVEHRIAWEGVPEEVRLPSDFDGVVELRFSGEPHPPCFLMRADCCPQLRAAYVVIQPDVVREDPTRGWVPLGGSHEHTEEFGGISPYHWLRFDPESAQCAIDIYEDRVDIVAISHEEVMVRVPKDIGQTARPRIRPTRVTR